jgi:hypothetical protein
MKFIHSYWAMISYWEIIKLYRKHALPGAFFNLTMLACRNELLMRIAHTVHLCRQIAKEYDVGPDARTTLAEIEALFERGDTPDRSALNFDDCGVKPFRDKVLAHPLNQTKAVLGKQGYQISLKWATVEETLSKIKEFANEVEGHNLGSGKWHSATLKDEVIGLEPAFMDVKLALEAAAKFDRLRRAILIKGGKAPYPLTGDQAKLAWSRSPKEA